MTETQDIKITSKLFFNKVLTGTVQGTIIALILNAVLGAILKYVSLYDLVWFIIDNGFIFQLATLLIIGGLIVYQFGLSLAKMMMPNLFKYPIILVPNLFTAVLFSISVALH